MVMDWPAFYVMVSPDGHEIARVHLWLNSTYLSTWNDGDRDLLAVLFVIDAYHDCLRDVVQPKDLSFNVQGREFIPAGFDDWVR